MPSGAVITTVGAPTAVIVAVVGGWHPPLPLSSRWWWVGGAVPLLGPHCRRRRRWWVGGAPAPSLPLWGPLLPSRHRWRVVPPIAAVVVVVMVVGQCLLMPWSLWCPHCGGPFGGASPSCRVVVSKMGWDGALTSVASSAPAVVVLLVMVPCHWWQVVSE